MDRGVSMCPAASLSPSIMPAIEILQSASVDREPENSVQASCPEQSREGLKGSAYPLLSWIVDVLVGLEQGPYVDGLAAPEVSVDSPVESQLQGPPVERAASTK